MRRVHYVGQALSRWATGARCDYEWSHYRLCVDLPIAFYPDRKPQSFGCFGERGRGNIVPSFNSCDSGTRESGAPTQLFLGPAALLAGGAHRSTQDGGCPLIVLHHFIAFAGMVSDGCA